MLRSKRSYHLSAKACYCLCKNILDSLDGKPCKQILSKIIIENWGGAKIRVTELW